MSLKRGFVIAIVLALTLSVNACRRIVDLTPFRDALNDDATLDTFDASLGSGSAFGDAGVPHDIGSD